MRNLENFVPESLAPITRVAKQTLQSVDASRWQQSAEIVARDLLGRYLVRNLDDGKRLILQIIETEAYLGATDKASHAFGNRRTKRTESLYLPGGYTYVYLIYGLYHCFNLVTGDSNNGEAVLIRAGAPVQGRDSMTAYRLRNRKTKIRSDGNAQALKTGELAGGPGRLCQAMAINRSHDAINLDGTDVANSPILITQGEPVMDDHRIAVGPRIGIDYAEEARDWPLRFAIADHPEMSKPILTSIAT